MAYTENLYLSIISSAFASGLEARSTRSNGHSSNGHTVTARSRKLTSFYKKFARQLVLSLKEHAKARILEEFMIYHFPVNSNCANHAIASVLHSACRYRQSSPNFLMVVAYR